MSNATNAAAAPVAITFLPVAPIAVPTAAERAAAVATVRRAVNAWLYSV